MRHGLRRRHCKGYHLPVSNASMLSQTERNEILDELGSPRAVYPRCLIHKVLETQAERFPERVAVVCEGRPLTYSELNSRANRLAHYLKEQGIGADRLVGICAARSLEMVVGLLAILKAGGAYVPLDPNYPGERLACMVEDAAPEVLLIQEALRAVLPQTKARVIALDTDWDEISCRSGLNLTGVAQDLRPDHLAYVIYTSGSSGKPKGVMVEHGNVTRLLHATQSWFRFDEQDVWTFFHSFAFDFSVWELWCALLYGGRVVVVPHLTSRSPQQFYRLICTEQVTILNQTPSAFAQLIEAQEREKEHHSLRVVIFGGEALELRSLLPWAQRNDLARTRLANMYGITETTVHVTYHSLTLQEIESERGSVVGRPIPDLRVYILDPHRQPVAIGVIGEWYIGGAGVARGYLNRPELTQERFIEDPFSSGGRMYKTGDLGRWRTDGTIEYLGRNDQLVKIRGFRIELGEIESQLMRHPQVREAVVLAREDVPGEKQLVAYVIAKPSQAGAVLGADELRAHLKEVLPTNMVPGAFVTLERFPLTTNGKLDRRALPAPQQKAYASREYEAPQGQVEEVLAGIWQELLRIERVGRRDNFFELGGHSLLMVQMLERLRRVGLSTQVRRVFESPVLSELAGELTRGEAEHEQVPENLIPAGCTRITPQMLPLVELIAEQIERIGHAVPGGAANIQDIYPLAPLQEGILFHHLLEKGGSGDTYVLPSALVVSSRDILDKLVIALQCVIDRHDVLRTAVLWEDLPRPVQVVYRRATLMVEQAALELDRDPLEQIAEWVSPERQSVDLRQAPLLRMRIAPDPRDGQWYVMLQSHHIICDHVTEETIIAEAVAHLKGEAQTLPSCAPYRNHVAQALAYARSHDSESFFRARLQDIDEPTAPFGLSDVLGDGTRIAEARLEFEPELSARLRRLMRSLGMSPATLFHAAWGLVLAQTTGRDDVVFGSLLLGRLQGSAGAQRTLGMFINTLPLRLTLGTLTAEELLERTQQELVALLGHEQASLAAAQRCSGIVGSAPLFTSLLNYRHSVPHPGSEWSSVAGIRVLTVRELTNYPITNSVDEFSAGFGLVVFLVWCFV